MQLRFPGSLAFAPVLVATVLGFGVTAGGQAPPRARPPARPRPRRPTRSPASPSATSAPSTMGGRIDDLAVLESNPAVFYVGAATGGLWRTTNNGTTWDVLFDDLDDVVSIGDIAIAPNDANTVWVGSGENNNRQSGSWGNGVYKSTDAGQTWKHMGLADSRAIARVIVDPVDHDVVYVAALGSVFGPRPRARRLQDHRRRPHLDQRPVRERRHRRHRAGDGPLEQQGALRRHLSAAPRHLGLQRRRAGQRHPQVVGCGPHLDQADQRHPAGPTRTHRPGRLPRQSEHRLRAGGAREGERRLPLRQRRPVVAEDVERQPAADVLQPDPHRPDQRPAHLRARRPAPHLGRRRQDLHRERGDALGPPRDVDQPGQPESHHRRQRRRRRHQLGQGRDLGGLHQHGPRAVLPRRLRHADAVSRLRRPAGQLHVVRPEPGPQPHRHRHRRLALDPGRRRLRGADGPARRTHRLRRIAGRQHRPHRSADRTSASRSVRWRRRASRRCAGTGTRRSCCRCTTRTRCTWARTRCSSRPTAARRGP